MYHSAVLQGFGYAGTLLKASRLHYWLKNILLIVPAILAGSINSETVWLLSIGYLAFGCAASAHYLFNDFLDRDDDRRDSANCSRPQAMGELQPHLMISLTLAFICAATICGSLLPAGFQMTLCCYFGLSVLYSLRL